VLIEIVTGKSSQWQKRRADKVGVLSTLYKKSANSDLNPAPTLPSSNCWHVFRTEPEAKKKINVFLVELFLQNWCSHAVFWGFVFLLSREIPDGEKRCEMVVNLILRYEKNGIWIEYIIPLYYSTFWRRWYRIYSLDGWRITGCIGKE
jgi:hypothetical protein